VMERVNVRHLTSLPERPSLAVLDLSFISLTQVLPAVARLVTDGADVVALIKPQFEAGRQSVGRGVVRSEAVWREVLERLAAWLDQNGWCLEGLSASPLRGASGNVEFLAHLCLGVSSRPAAPLIDAALDEARTLARP
jgi:23S rRNA (cytidine1920-2'-O)/16S rRNA (cytidine1409-2'-O)-methyltransferase